MCEEIKSANSSGIRNFNIAMCAKVIRHTLPTKQHVSVDSNSRLHTPEQKILCATRAERSTCTRVCYFSPSATPRAKKTHSCRNLVLPHSVTQISN